MNQKNNSRKRQLKGVVVSDKMEKTIVVEVETKKQHPLYSKIVKTHKKYYAHDEMNEYKNGDKVIIEDYRPTSKLKRWIVVRKES